MCVCAYCYRYFVCVAADEKGVSAGTHGHLSLFSFASCVIECVEFHFGLAVINAGRLNSQSVFRGVGSCGIKFLSRNQKGHPSLSIFFRPNKPISPYRPTTKRATSSRNQFLEIEFSSFDQRSSAKNQFIQLSPPPSSSSIYLSLSPFDKNPNDPDDVHPTPPHLFPLSIVLLCVPRIDI